MAITLEDIQKTTPDALCAQVIDTFRKSNYLFNAMVFDDAVSPAGGGATMSYAYTRVITQPTAATRALGSEYAPQEAKKERFTVDLKVLGGSFEIDRVLAGMGGETIQNILMRRTDFYYLVLAKRPIFWLSATAAEHLKKLFESYQLERQRKQKLNNIMISSTLAPCMQGGVKYVGRI